MTLPIYLEENSNTIKIDSVTKFKIGSSYYNYAKHTVINEILNDFEDGCIDRKDVTKYFKKDKILHGFYAAMIWGGISTGGVAGDNLSLLLSVDHSQIIEIIEKVKELINKNKFKEAYIYMDTEGKLKGLGDSFYTKLFFFLGDASEQDIIPPIFDKWTKLAYYGLLIQSENLDIANKYIVSVNGVQVNFRSKHRADAYEDYVLKMNLWANKLGTSVSYVEQFVFGNDKRKDKSSSNPRNVFEEIVSEFRLLRSVKT